MRDFPLVRTAALWSGELVVQVWHVSVLVEDGTTEYLNL